MRLTAAAAVGDAVTSIQTPALVIDLDAMRRNLAAMADFARQRGLRLRPHAKMHKSAQLARLQMDAGAVGVCVQKLSEAQALAAAGIDDIFISNEIVDKAKLADVAVLARQVRLAICVDSATGIERLAAAARQAGSQIDVLIELDVGQGRCGVSADEAGPLAELLSQHCGNDTNCGLRFAGIQAYHGGAQHLRSDADRRLAIERVCRLVRQALAGLAQRGINCPLVTGAGSGSFIHEAASGLYGELQAGSYLFMDADYAANQLAAEAPRFEHALFIRSQVISRRPDRAVIDAGHKSHAIDSGMPLVWRQRLDYSNGGDEHGILKSAGDALPELGDNVWLVPGHCDPTVNLHDQYIAVGGGLDRGTVEALWPVDARGCIR